MESGEELLHVELESDGELRDLLLRLENFSGEGDVLSKRQRDVVTVEDVAEALGLEPEFVASELVDMRRQDIEAMLVGVMRELEEPTYRVERTSPELRRDANPLLKLRSVRELMERNRPQLELPRRPKQSAEELRREREQSQRTLFILIGIAVLIVLIGLLR
jgi:hypothetical protein